MNDLKTPTAICVIGIALMLWVGVPSANGRYGGETPGVITDMPQTVRAIEERADINWAVNTAGAWDKEDFAACDKPGARVSESMLRCMVIRSNTRFLFMLRRGCVGLNTIASVCKMEVQ